MIEFWKPIPGYPSYQASSRGRIRRVRASQGVRPGKILVGRVDARGRRMVDLREVDGRTSSAASRLVCLAFKGLPPTDKHHAAHNDGDCSNDVPSNLRWATAKENAADRKLHGTHQEGESCPFSKLTGAQVIRIRTSKRTQRALAAKYGVSQTTIHDAIHGKNWGHL